MKIKIGPYTHWFGPYQLAEKLCFWAKPVEDEYGMKSKPHWVHQFGEWLAHGSVKPEAEVGELTSHDRRTNTWLHNFLIWVESKKKRTIKVHIDRWDTWSMDSTLAYIVLPMLKQLKARKHGAPQVDDKDVPKELHMTKKEKAAFDKDGSTDDKFFKRWDWVMDEMIFAFDSKVNDGRWEEQFESGTSDMQWKRLENGNYEMVRGPNDTKVYDWEGRKAYEARIQNGFRLFGKYYQNLWD